jgi:hypothetical protein
MIVLMTAGVREAASQRDHFSRTSARIPALHPRSRLANKCGHFFFSRTNQAGLDNCQPRQALPII